MKPDSWTITVGSIATTASGLKLADNSHQLLAQRQVVLKRAVWAVQKVNALVSHDRRGSALLPLAQAGELERVGGRVVGPGVTARAAH